RMAHDDRAAGLGDDGRGFFPHLARSLRRISEAIDESLDNGAIVIRHAQQTAHHRNQRQAADALRRPVGADLAARNAPHLLGVGFEEDLVEPASEGADDPIFEAGDVRGWLTLYLDVADEAAHGLQRTE